MRRRDFMTQLAAGLAGSALARGAQRQRSAAHGRRSRSGSGGKRERIAVSSWSFHNYFPKTRRKDFAQPGPTLALLDFPEMIADRYKVHNLEFVAPHLASIEPAYLQELRNRLQRSRSHLVNIPVDIPELHASGGLSSDEAKEREKAVKAVKPWIDLARALGAKSVRCDPGQMDAEELDRTVDSYRKLVAYAKSKGVRVIIENHGGVGSEHPEELVRVFKAVKGDFIGALPDFGNFPDEETRQRGLGLLFPYARTVCHAKGLEFDASGKETKFNFQKCVEISKQAHYKGVYSIEYEGHGDPYEGVQRVVDELLEYL